MPEEPAENISGGSGGGGVETAFPAAEADTRAEAVIDELGDLYWRKAYGGQDAFECLVRTILSQNTSDVASQPAHDALMDRYGGGSNGESSPDRVDLARALATADREELADVIRPAGLYNQKSRMIVEAAAEIVAEFGGVSGSDQDPAASETEFRPEESFDEFVREEDPAAVRNRLLDIRGVGPKTADCVLLFSGGRHGVFPVDTHVHRISRRLGIAPPDADHEGVREALERNVPPEKCGFGHTAMIQFGREYCTARKPACLDGPEECPLYDLCDRTGVDPETGAVVDPAAASE